MRVLHFRAVTVICVGECGGHSNFQQFKYGNTPRQDYAKAPCTRSELGIPPREGSSFYSKFPVPVQTLNTSGACVKGHMGIGEEEMAVPSWFLLIFAISLPPAACVPMGTTLLPC